MKEVDPFVHAAAATTIEKRKAEVSKSKKSAKEMRAEILAGIKATQAAFSGVMLSYVHEVGVVKNCDGIIAEVNQILSSLYQSLWDLIVFTESWGYDAYQIEVAGLRATTNRANHLQKAAVFRTQP